jgi:hypothetical protein
LTKQENLKKTESLNADVKNEVERNDASRTGVYVFWAAAWIIVIVVVLYLLISPGGSAGHQARLHVKPLPDGSFVPIENESLENEKLTKNSGQKKARIHTSSTPGGKLSETSGKNDKTKLPVSLHRPKYKEIQPEEARSTLSLERKNDRNERLEMLRMRKLIQKRKK